VVIILNSLGLFFVTTPHFRCAVNYHYKPHAQISTIVKTWGLLNRYSVNTAYSQHSVDTHLLKQYSVDTHLLKQYSVDMHLLKQYSVDTHLYLKGVCNRLFNSVFLAKWIHSSTKWVFSEYSFSNFDPQ
jgi:hypothetical protein